MSDDRTAREGGWAYRKRSGMPVADCDEQPHVPAFRSDNDLHQWRYEWGLVTGSAGAMITALYHWSVPLHFWLFGLIPLIATFLLSRWYARRNRRFGKRFSHYEDDQLNR